MKSVVTNWLINKFFDSYNFNEQLREKIQKHHPELHRPTSGYPDFIASPYSRMSDTEVKQHAIKKPIFITARFRTGSTLLWQIFNQIQGITAYYEPLNERKWFKAGQQNPIDPTHKGVSSYSENYQGLEELDKFFHPDWSFTNLFMDRHSWDDNLYQYIHTLIRHAPNRPVLQFNRIDFRLEWLRAYFPEAQILHLYRNPQDQWLSTLRDTSALAVTSLKQFKTHTDHYYLGHWQRALKGLFPILDITDCSHPYMLFYLIWRLSYIFGAKYSDHSIAYENLAENCADTLQGLNKKFQLGLDDNTVKRLEATIEQPHHYPALKSYKEQFLEIENICEERLARFLSQ